MIMICEFDGVEVLVCVDELVDVLCDCVEGGVFVGFMLLFVYGWLEVFWCKVVVGVVVGE